VEANKKETPLLSQEEPQATEHEQSISEKKPIVNPDATTWLADMRREKQMQAKDVVPVIRARHPKFDAALYSKIERPGEYGVELIRSTAKAVKEAFDFKPAPRARRADNRALPCRVQFRLSNDDFRRLQTAQNAAGYDTNQEWGHAMALKFIADSEGMA